MKDKISTIVFILISLFECATVILGLPGLLGDVLLKCGIIFLGVCGSWSFWLMKGRVVIDQQIRWWLLMGLMWTFIILTAGIMLIGITGLIGYNWMKASALQIILLVVLWLFALKKTK